MTLLRLLLVLILSVHFAGAVLADNLPVRKNIVVLHNLGQRGYWQNDFDQKFLADLRMNSDFEPAVFVDDLGLNLPEANPDAIRDRLARKYEKINVDAVVAVLPPANRFLEANREALFPGAATTFVIPPASVRNTANKRQQAAVVKSASRTAIQQTIQHMKTMMPDLKTIYLISGIDATDNYYFSVANDVLREHRGNIAVKNLRGLPLRQMMDKAAEVEPNSAFLFLVYGKDSDGQTYKSTDVIPLMSKAANAPIFAFYDTLVSKGAVGGATTSAASYADAAAEFVVQFLSGQASEKPKERESDITSYYDDRQMRRFGLDAGLLKGNVVLINQDRNVFNEYPRFTTAILVLVVLLAIVLAGLAVSLRKARQTGVRLKQREALFRAVTDISPLAIYMWEGAEQRGAYMNDTFVKLFGYTLDDVPSVFDWWPLAYPDEAYRKQISEEWQARVSYAVDHQLRIEPLEAIVRCKDGSSRTIVWDFMSIGNQNWAFGLDLTDRKHAEDQLRAAKDDAIEANRAKSEFLAAMSHELRTPLNAILGFSEVLSGQYLGPPKAGQYREYARDIHQSGEHLLELVNDLLDISTIESGKRSLDIQTMSSWELVDTCIQIVEEKSKEREIRLKTNAAASPFQFFADKRAMKQIILNLPSNAIKFTLPGGEIYVSAERTPHGVAFNIRDTGIGIPEDKLPGITDPFARGNKDAHLTDDGWGLGLSITKSLVELHNGQLEINSAPGKGTSVSVFLPN